MESKVFFSVGYCVTVETEDNKLLKTSLCACVCSGQHMNMGHGNGSGVLSIPVCTQLNITTNYTLILTFS